jgi:hypothetical protein
VRKINSPKPGPLFPSREDGPQCAAYCVYVAECPLQRTTGVESACTSADVEMIDCLDSA